MSEGGISRRQLLVGGVGAAGGLVVAGIVPAVLLTTPRQKLADLTQAMFAAQVGTTFKIAGARATLASVTPFAAPAAGLPARGEAFTLVFSGPAGLKAGIHDVEHVTLGRFQLHVDEEHRAVFNRQWS